MSLRYLIYSNLINPIPFAGQGFMYLLLNFNHERFVISASTCRFARLCYAEALSLGAGGKKKVVVLGDIFIPLFIGDIIISKTGQDRYIILEYFGFFYIYIYL